jgi:hypothetical protein
MKLGTWNIRSLYKAGSHTTAARELGRYKLNLHRKLGGTKGAQ